MDEALFAARDRLSMMLSNLPSVRVKLRAAGAELHIIGRDQVTTDLPEWRQDKGKPLAEYNGLTRDQRTRGMGGLHDFVRGGESAQAGERPLPGPRHLRRTSSPTTSSARRVARRAAEGPRAVSTFA